MKSLLLTLMMLLISITLACSAKMDQQDLDLASNINTSNINIDGKWAGVYGGMGTMTYEFLVQGNKLYGTTIGEGDSRIDIVKGKVKTSKKKGTEISFEVPVSAGGAKMSIVYTGEVIDENTIELTFKTRARGSRNVGFDGFNDGFGGGGGGGGGGFSSGFGGGGSSETKFVIKRVDHF
jgi:uncharacterized membrane protein YgcG